MLGLLLQLGNWPRTRNIKMLWRRQGGVWFYSFGGRNFWSVVTLCFACVCCRQLPIAPQLVVGVLPSWSHFLQQLSVSSWTNNAQAKLIHSLSSPPACVLRNRAKTFIIHCSSLNNHFPDSVYVWVAFTAKIMVWGTIWMMVYPLESSKIVIELSKVSTKSQRMHKQDV